VKVGRNEVAESITRSTVASRPRRRRARGHRDVALRDRVTPGHATRRRGNPGLQRQLTGVAVRSMKNRLGDSERHCILEIAEQTGCVVE